MDLRYPKTFNQSIIYSKAKLIQLLSVLLLVVNTVGIGAVITVIPAKYQAGTTNTLILIDLVSYLFGVQGSGQIAKERLSKGDLHHANGSGKHQILLDTPELDRFLKLQDHIQDGRPLNSGVISYRDLNSDGET